MRKALFHGYVVAWLPPSPFCLSISLPIIVPWTMFTSLRVCITSPSRSSGEKGEMGFCWLALKADIPVWSSKEEAHRNWARSYGWLG